MGRSGKRIAEEVVATGKATQKEALTLARCLLREISGHDNTISDYGKIMDRLIRERDEARAQRRTP